MSSCREAGAEASRQAELAAHLDVASAVEAVKLVDNLKHGALDLVVATCPRQSVNQNFSVRVRALQECELSGTEDQGQ